MVKKKFDLSKMWVGWAMVKEYNMKRPALSKGIKIFATKKAAQKYYGKDCLAITKADASSFAVGEGLD